VTGATSIYYAPDSHNVVILWDGTRWVCVSFTETTLAVGTVTSGLPYDIFGYLSGGSLTLESLAWSSATARATAVTRQDGRVSKSGDKTRLLLGTFVPTSTSATEDSMSKRLLWNNYNRRERYLVRKETGQWNYTTAAFRQANASTANQVEYACGLDEDAVDCVVMGMSTNATSVANTLGIGLDSTTVNSATFYGRNAGSNVEQHMCVYRGHPGIGYRKLMWLEYSAVGGTTTWYGDAGNPTAYQFGITATVRG
jgi:hypothetical protein